MSKHTPGPWHRNIRGNGKYPTVFAGRNTHVAVAAQMGSGDETEANIDLIAAAPDLLAALEFAYQELETAHRFKVGLINPEALGDARDAIAKARGE